MPMNAGFPCVLWDTTQGRFLKTFFFGEEKLKRNLPESNDVSRHRTLEGGWTYVEYGSIFKLSKLSLVFPSLKEENRRIIATYLEHSVLSFRYFNRTIFTIPANEFYSSIESFKTLEYSIDPKIVIPALCIFQFIIDSDYVLPFDFYIRLMLTGWKIEPEQFIKHRGEKTINVPNNSET